jgi:hypothetical protein
MWQGTWPGILTQRMMMHNKCIALRQASPSFLAAAYRGDQNNGDCEQQDSSIYALCDRYCHKRNDILSEANGKE